MVVTKDKEVALDSVLWSKVSKKLRALKTSAYPKIITHDIEELNKKLSEGQYFFTDIRKEGVLLFDTEKFELVGKRNLSNQAKQRIAQEHFNYWFDKSRLFLGDYNSNLDKFKATENTKFLAQSAFHLHQIAESCYKGTLLVFINYTPREHFLEILGKEAEKHCPQLKNIFPKSTKEEEDRFKLLEYAYIGGRYDPDYRISKEDLEILMGNVKNLLEITEEICKKKIQSFVD